MNRKHHPFSTIASILLAIVLLPASTPLPVLTSSVPSVSSVAYGCDANDRLLSEDGTSYSYDDNGNMIAKVSAAESISYNYDYQNRLTQVSGSDGSVIEYGYDPDGIRISKTIDGTDVTNYLVDKNRPYAQVLEERDGSSTLQVSYIYGDDLISQNRGSVDSYYHYDGQLSTRALSDSTATVTDTYTYDAFGNLIEQTGTTVNDYLYAGEQYDPNAGFYYLRARYYDTGIGRFVTQDPLAGSEYDPVTLHRYLYVANDPVNKWDFSGNEILEPQDWFLGIKVHQILFAHFEDWARRNGVSVMTNRAINTIFDRLRINRIPGDKKTLSGKLARILRPDLIDLDNKEIYEIKPIGTYLLGSRQVQDYLELLNEYDSGWTVGTRYTPMRQFSALGCPVFVDPPVNGVIEYTRIPRTEALAGLSGLVSIAIQSRYWLSIRMTARVTLAAFTRI